MIKKFLVMSMAVLAVCSCKDNDANVKQEQKTPVVDAVRLIEQDIPLSFEYAARAQGSKETEVRARVGGILKKRNYVEGAEVKEGDVLFEIDPEPFKIELQKAKAKLAQSQAQLSSVETQWVRIQELYKDRIVSEKSRDETKSELESLRASVDLAKAEVDAAQLNTTVKAPISGITSLETHSEGSLISIIGDSGLLTKIVCLDPIYVTFSISENEMQSLSSMVQKGLILNPESKDEIKAELQIADGVVYEHLGDINFINPNIDESTGTIKSRAVVENPNNKIIPGQFLRLMLNGLTRINAITLPQEAVMQGAEGAFVYKINNEGIVEVANVVIGLTTKDGKWIIDEGLNEGDVVITSGLMKVKPAMKVNPNIVNK